MPFTFHIFIFIETTWPILRLYGIFEYYGEIAIFMIKTRESIDVRTVIHNLLRKFQYPLRYIEMSNNQNLRFLLSVLDSRKGYCDQFDIAC